MEQMVRQHCNYEKVWDLKKIKQLLFYSMPLARKFAEQLASPSPDPRREYWVTEDQNEPDPMVEMEQDEAEETTGTSDAADEERPDKENRLARFQASPRKRAANRTGGEANQAKIARVESMPTFPFEDAYDEFM